MNKSVYLFAGISGLLIIGISLGWIISSTFANSDSWVNRVKASYYESTSELYADPGTKSSLMNFNETGNIVKTGDWGLVYEKPGEPALKVSLIFNKGSLCRIGDNVEICNMDKLTVGDRVKIEGRKSNNDVGVFRLYKPAILDISNPASTNCMNQGGTVHIVKDPDGSEKGLCVFPDGKQCDEWNFFRSKVCQ